MIRLRTVEVLGSISTLVALLKAKGQFSLKRYKLQHAASCDAEMLRHLRQYKLTGQMSQTKFFANISLH